MENTDDAVEEEEEIIVYAHFEDGTVDREIFQNSDLKFKVIGLDSDTPIIQLGDQAFKGTWNDTIGTRVFFEEDPSHEHEVDPVFTVLPPKMLKYKCMSTKTLDLSRIFLKAKSTEKIIDKELHDNSINNSLEEQNEVFTLAQSTVNPDLNSDIVMNDIIAEAMMQFKE